jgi:hypothetical protein
MAPIFKKNVVDLRHFEKCASKAFISTGPCCAMLMGRICISLLT